MTVQVVRVGSGDGVRTVPVGAGPGGAGVVVGAPGASFGALADLDDAATAPIGVPLALERDPDRRWHLVVIDDAHGTAIAATVLSGHRVVTPLPDGRVRYASAADDGDVHVPLWVTLGAAADDTVVAIATTGPVDEPSWSWTPRLPVWLGVDGQLTQTPPVRPTARFAAQVGVATAPTRIVVGRMPSIVLI